MELVYNSLKKAKNMNVYKKGELPDELHYKNNVRHGDILLVADSGYMISVTKKEAKYYPGIVNLSIINKKNIYYELKVIILTP